EPSQTSTLPLMSADRSWRLSGLNATARTGRSPSPASVSNSFPLPTPHTFRLQSRLPETSRVPSALNATQFAACECPANVATSRPVSTSHTFPPPRCTRGSVLIPEHARNLPSGEKTRPSTDVSPVSPAHSPRRFSTSHTSTDPPALAATNRPFG